MISIKTQMAAQTPSGFGMPISGHAFGVTTGASDVCTATRPERVRVAATAGTWAVKADMGLAQPYFPGTSAWRPPTC